MKKILLILLIISSLFLTIGCETPKESISSENQKKETKTGITGQLLIGDKPITNAKIVIGDNIAKPNNDGNYTLLLSSPGEYEMNIITLFDTTTIPVTVNENELINVDKKYKYSDWGLAEIMDEKEYYVENEKCAYYYDSSKEDEEKMLIKASLYDILTDMEIKHMAYDSTITYHFEDNIHEDYIKTAKETFKKIESEMNNLFTFKEVDSKEKAIYQYQYKAPDFAYCRRHFVTQTREIIKSEIIIPDHEFDYGSYDAPENGAYKAVLIHETIHALGIGHFPYSSKDGVFNGEDLMMFYYTNDATEVSNITWKTIKLYYSTRPVYKSNNIQSIIENNIDITTIY